MACFATPYGLHYAAHCFNRAYAQNNRPALIPAGGKLGVTSVRGKLIPRKSLPRVKGDKLVLEWADIGAERGMP